MGRGGAEERHLGHGRVDSARKQEHSLFGQTPRSIEVSTVWARESTVLPGCLHVICLSKPLAPLSDENTVQKGQRSASPERSGGGCGAGVWNT